MKWEWRDRYPVKGAREAVRDLFDRLASFDPVQDGATPADDFVKLPHYHFDDEAQEIFVEWCTELHTVHIATEQNPLMQQHFGKFEKLFCAIAMILHLAEDAIGPVKASSALRAAAWCTYLTGHARRVYGLVEASKVNTARMVGRRIADGKTDRCIYCGGNVLADTVDHCPARAFFYQRKWPEGYVFPSCEACNSSTKEAENWVALLSMMYSDDPEHHNHHQVQFDKLAGSLLTPEVARRMQVPAVKKRALARRASIRPRAGQAYGDLEIVQVPDEAEAAVPVFAAKVAKALHFFHTSRIVPVRAAIEHRAFTNFDVIEGGVPQEVFTLPTGIPSLTRTKVDLGRQFNYLYGVSADGEMSMFTMWFRKAFCLAVILTFDPDVMRSIEIDAEKEPEYRASNPDAPAEAH